MSAIILQPVGPTGRQRIAWKPAARATWLQHRATLAGVFGLFVLLALVMVVGTLGIHDAYARYVADGCLTSSPATICAPLNNSFVNSGVGVTAVVIALNVLPILIGVFVGAPLVAREIETGTYRFAWTQGVGRKRWLIGRLLGLAGTLALASCLLGLLGSWCVGPFDAVGLGSRWQPGQFGISALTLPAWTVFAFALGVVIGAVVRRTVASMAVTAGVLGGLAVATFLRLGDYLLNIGRLTAHSLPNVYPGTGAINGFLVNGTIPPSGSWLVSGLYTGPSGHQLSDAAAARMVNHMLSDKAVSSGVGPWLASHHYAYFVTYQPAGRLSMFQGAEAAVLLAAAVLCGLGTLWLVRRHT